MGASCGEICTLVKGEGRLFERETLGGPLERGELGSGPERGVGWREVESHHGERRLGVIRLDCTVWMWILRHRWGEGDAGRETAAAVGDSEEWVGCLYMSVGGHHGEMMARLMGAYGRRGIWWAPVIRISHELQLFPHQLPQSALLSSTSPAPLRSLFLLSCKAPHKHRRTPSKLWIQMEQ